MSAANSRPGYLFILTWPISISGGVNEVVLSLADQVATRGYRPIIGIANWDETQQAPSYRGIELAALRLREPLSPDGTTSHWKGFARTFWRDSRALQRLVAERGISVVNSHFPNLETITPALLRARNRLNARYVLSFHGADAVPMCASQGLARRLWSFVLRSADAVTACSAALARDIQQFEPAVHPIAIHNGVDATLFPAAPRSPSNLLLNIGKFERKKGQDLLLRAFRRFIDNGADARLLLVGGEGPEIEHIRALIAQLSLQDRVEMRVNVPHDQIPNIMRGARCFVLPSRLEPFGIVLLEAGAAHLPVIATSVGGVPELIEPDVTGLLIPPDDEDALLAAIQRLWTDQALAESLAACWHERVLSNWSWERTATRYLEAAGGSV